jgi:hypothetical protein
MDMDIKFARKFREMIEMPHIKEILALRISDAQKMAKILPTLLDEKYGEVDLSYFEFFKYWTDVALKQEEDENE